VIVFFREVPHHLGFGVLLFAVISHADLDRHDR
jgi:hypothetical protein